MNDLDSLVQSAESEFTAAATPAELENAKARFLGKTGRVTELLKGMAALSVEEKKTRGAEINVVKQRIEAALTARRQALADAELQAQLKAEALDVTLLYNVGRSLADSTRWPEWKAGSEFKALRDQSAQKRH